MYVAVNFINMDKIIARNNIDRYLADPNNVEFDAYYLRDNVGTDAAEELIKILKYDEGKISRKNKATFIRNKFYQMICCWKILLLGIVKTCFINSRFILFCSYS